MDLMNLKWEVNPSTSISNTHLVARNKDATEEKQWPIKRITFPPSVIDKYFPGDVKYVSFAFYKEKLFIQFTPSEKIPRYKLRTTKRGGTLNSSTFLPKIWKHFNIDNNLSKVYLNIERKGMMKDGAEVFELIPNITSSSQKPDD